MKLLSKKIVKGTSYPTVTFFLGIFLAIVVTQVMAHGGNTNLIHGCVKTSNGAIKIVGANDSCGSGEIALDWNIQGVQGVQGPQGPAGVNDIPVLCPGCHIFNDGNHDLGDKLAGKDFTNAYIKGADFNGTIPANLQDTNFTGADIREVNFIETNLSNANFSNVYAVAAYFTGANLTNVNFTGAVLDDAHDIDTTTRPGLIWSNTVCPDHTNSDNNGNTCEGHLIP